MNNAIKFTDLKGTIIIKVTVKESAIKIAVIDNGIGIEPARLAVIKRVL